MSSKEPSWIGQQLGGRYEVEELIDRGGMSSVYRATDPNLKRKVAIKIIHPHLTDSPEFIQRFEQEAASIAQLRHNNIVQVHDFNQDSNTYYMVMEYVAGESLADKLRSLNQAQMRLPIKDSISIMAKVCHAVDYAHQRFMIHRDIKPANVVINLLGEPILMDFGIAKILGGHSHTATGAAMGTATYMSPEQVKGDKSDHRVDIYSLGIMLYEMFSGEPPFMGGSSFQIMMKHVNELIPDIRQFDSHTPIAIINILDLALAKNPDERYQSAKEMAIALETAAVQLQGSVTDTLAVRYLDQLSTLHQQAIDLFNASRYAFCIDKLDELVRVDPDFQRDGVNGLRQKSINKLFELASRLHQDGDYTESLKVLETFHQHSPDEPKIKQLDQQIRTGLGNQALIAKLDSQYKEAAALLEAHTYDQALAKWGIIQRQRGDVPFEDSLDIERRAIEGICSLLYDQSLMALTKNNPEQALQYWHKLIAYNPSFMDTQHVEATAELQLSSRKKKMLLNRVSLVLVGVLLLIFIFFNNKDNNNAIVSAIEPTATTLIILEPPEVELTAVSLTTVDSEVVEPTDDAQEVTITAVPTNTSVATILTLTTEPSPTPEQVTAVARQPATLFEAPSSTAPQVAFINLNESVIVLGRTNNQSWFLILTQKNEAGYVAANRFALSVPVADLPIVTSNVQPNIVSTRISGNFSPLSADIYPLNGTARFEGENWFVRLYVEGHGGNNSYDIYWNDVLQAENVSPSIAFEITGVGSNIIGTVRIESGDGQTLFHEQFVSRP